MRLLVPLLMFRMRTALHQKLIFILSLLILVSHSYLQNVTTLNHHAQYHDKSSHEYPVSFEFICV